MKIEWNGITVTVEHEASYLNTEFDHIQVRADEQLPFTETGYRSHFIHTKELALFDSPQQFVLEWLDEAAQSKEWRQHVIASKQLSLF